MADLLSGNELLRALEVPNRIFREGSWEPGRIRGAGYSVRLACDLLVVPQAPGESRYQAIGPQDARKNIRLMPGDSALISTVEKFSFDFDISATIFEKFTLAAQGLLMLHGGAVHPGYGREMDPQSGSWVPKPDERLYFIVANVGPEDIYLRERDEIAYLQFFEVLPAEKREEIKNLGFEHLSRLFNADHNTEDGGMSYFRGVRDLRNEFKRDLKEIRDDIDRLDAKVKITETSIDRVSNASNAIVVFGVFLVGVTILGVVLSTLIGQIENLPEHPGGGWLTAIVILAVLYSVCAIAGVGFVARASLETVRKHKPNQSQRDAAHPAPAKIEP